MNYSNIIQYDMANGPGIRTSLFVSGCDFHCKGCFNQEAQNFDYGKHFSPDTMIEIQNLVEDEHIDGLSILGGDPLCQSECDIATLATLATYVKNLGKNVWIWSGFTWEQIFPKVIADEFDTLRFYRQMLIEACDIWVDGPFIESLKDLSLAWRGSTNQRIIDIQKSLEKHTIQNY